MRCKYIFILLRKFWTSRSVKRVFPFTTRSTVYTVPNSECKYGREIPRPTAESAPKISGPPAGSAQLCYALLTGLRDSPPPGNSGARPPRFSRRFVRGFPRSPWPGLYGGDGGGGVRAALRMR